MPRPIGVTITFALMCATTALDYLLILQQDRSTSSIITYTLIVAACYVFLWFYLQGRNWARWVAILLALQSLWIARSSLRQPLTPVHLGTLTTMIEALLALCLICYLSTPAVRLWFRGDHRALLKRR
ncbi:MAG: hypothetical protein JSS95_17085 [Acidobacteria bacterium]|nr:hypothetical protein [Acidobacteriota bacterium]